MKKNKVHLLIDQLELLSCEKKLKSPEMKLIDKIFIALGWVLAIPHLMKLGILYIWNIEGIKVFSIFFA